MTDLRQCHGKMVFSYLIQGALANVAWEAYDDVT